PHADPLSPCASFSFCSLSPPPFSFPHSSLFFFFHRPPPTELYTLSLHDALPILLRTHVSSGRLTFSSDFSQVRDARLHFAPGRRDRKSTRLNSSHVSISYAVFCLKKKKHKREKVSTRRAWQARASYVRLTPRSNV